MNSKFKWACKLTESTDKGGNTYMWGYARLGFFKTKIGLFQSKKEEGVWNLNLSYVEEDETQQNEGV